MAEFEGNLNLNVETSEIEIKGKFKLTEDELDTISGGSDYYDNRLLPNDVVNKQIVWAYDGKNGVWRYGEVTRTSANSITVSFGGGFSIVEGTPKTLEPNICDCPYVYTCPLEAGNHN